jgi:signal transduction histidine kinase
MGERASASTPSLRAPNVAILLTGGVALVAGTMAFAITISSEHQELRAVGHPAFAPFVPLIGWSFAASGLVAWRRRPASRFGPLMLAVALAWFAAALTAASDPRLFTVGRAIAPLWLGIFVHALLAFPDGRLGSPAARVVVGLYYVDVILLQLGWLVFADPAGEPGCRGCPQNLFMIADDPGLADLFLLLEQPIVGLLALTAALAVLAARWRAASRAYRRILAPVYISGATCIVILILTIAVEPFSYTAGQVVGWVGAIAFTAVPLAFLAGLLRQQLAHADVDSLLAELSGPRPPSDLRRTLRKALHDPSLEIAYWSPVLRGYVDAGGHPVNVPDDDERQGVTLVVHGSERVAALIHDVSLHENEQLMNSVCAAAGLALTNARLQAELRGRLEELKASRSRIIDVGVHERRRLERDLHDGAQRRLLSILFELRRARMATDRDEIDRLIEWSEEELKRSLDELRELARGIHPSVLTDYGLKVALEGVVVRAPVPTILDVELDRRPSSSVETALYFVACEALANAVKHADASKIQIRVVTDGGDLTMEVIDNGRGGADPNRGSGLRGMADRLAAVDGRLEIESDPAEGTVVRAVIPCES